MLTILTARFSTLVNNSYNYSASLRGDIRYLTIVDIYAVLGNVLWIKRATAISSFLPAARRRYVSLV